MGHKIVGFQFKISVRAHPRPEHAFRRLLGPNMLSLPDANLLWGNANSALNISLLQSIDSSLIKSTFRVKKFASDQVHLRVSSAKRLI